LGDLQFLLSSAQFQVRAGRLGGHHQHHAAPRGICGLFICLGRLHPVVDSAEQVHGPGGVEADLEQAVLPVQAAHADHGVAATESKERRADVGLRGEQCLRRLSAGPRLAQPRFGGGNAVVRGHRLLDEVREPIVAQLPPPPDFGRRVGIDERGRAGRPRGRLAIRRRHRGRRRLVFRPDHAAGDRKKRAERRRQHAS
jgi:hypothetical protein